MRGTALLAAAHSACWSNSSVAQVLLAQGARVDVCDEAGNTPLANAVSIIGESNVGDSVGFVQIALAYGANPLHANHQGQTPLSLARQQRCGISSVDEKVNRTVGMMQNAIKQRKALKAPR